MTGQHADPLDDLGHTLQREQAETQWQQQLHRPAHEAATENNLRLLVKTIRASGAEVLLIGVPEPRLFGGAPDFYERLAEELGLSLIHI